jgi:hemerythrin-like domain-containing protein
MRASRRKKEVKAIEDLMREHGVLRRALLVYTAAATRLRSGKGKVPADALMRTAQLFRTFGEDQHERMLEEPYVYPALASVKGPVGQLPDVLKVQHERGRPINDYVTSVTRAGNINSANGELEGLRGKAATSPVHLPIRGPRGRSSGTGGRCPAHAWPT